MAESRRSGTTSWRVTLAGCPRSAAQNRRCLITLTSCSRPANPGDAHDHSHELLRPTGSESKTHITTAEHPQGLFTLPQGQRRKRSGRMSTTAEQDASEQQTEILNERCLQQTRRPSKGVDESVLE